jgi:hypothetical protein
LAKLGDLGALIFKKRARCLCFFMRSPSSIAFRFNESDVHTPDGIDVNRQGFFSAQVAVDEQEFILMIFDHVSYKIFANGDFGAMQSIESKSHSSATGAGIQ